MTSSRRNKFEAASMFALIGVVVLAGMAWATSSSFELARKNVAEEHDQRISGAVWEMSSYMAGIINSETARTWQDYRAVQLRRALAVLSEGGQELDADLVVLPSVLATDAPPHGWIDLYFQQAYSGKFTSPQVQADAAMWRVERPQTNPALDFKRRRMLAWLAELLPDARLRERFAAAYGHGSGEVGSALPATQSESTGGRARADQEFARRTEVLRELQRGHVPPADCVDPHIAARHAQDYTEARLDLQYNGAQPTERVQVTCHAMSTFWMGDFDGVRELAFVRECHEDARVFYQGFIGNWDKLKPRLLEQIRDVLPEADLAAVEQSAEFTETQMHNLPVRLVVAGIPGGAAAAAWREIRGTLLITWLAAATVLVVAGWGLRNLVALTERRMQFAYAVTHELRTPLTTFRLYSDMLAAGLVPEASKQEYLETLDRESLRLSSLVEEVLDYARLENHKVKLNATTTDASTLLEKITEHLQKTCRDNGISPRMENAIENGRTMRTDVDLVNRIAAVLVNNACRHARGAENATVLVRLDDEESKLHLDVIDSGPGIDRADLRTIFKPFRRGRGADAAAQGGIGLGLALARSWASLLGGRLELAAGHDPKYGGAHFRLTIPVQIKQ